VRYSAWLGSLLVSIGLWCAACEQRTVAPHQASLSPSVPSVRDAVEQVPSVNFESASGDATRGHDLVQRFECNRCHEGTGFGAAPLAKN